MYKSLTDSTRKVTIRGTLSTKKGDEGIVGRSEYPYTSVDWQGEAWYRVMGDAGTRIREGDRQGWCKTGCPRSLPSGSHPKTPGELVNNVKVCLNCLDVSNIGWVGCNQPPWSKGVKIRHCGDYFVYYLTEERRLTVSRYCTE